MIRDLLSVLVKFSPALDILFRMTLLLALGWALHGALAGRNPRWRVLLWRAWAVGALLVPLLGPLMPGWQFPLPNLSSLAAMVADPADHDSFREGGATLPASSGDPGLRTWEQSTLYQLCIPIVLHPRLSLALAWAGVCLILGGRLLLNLGRVRRIIGASVPANGSIQNAFDELHAELGVDRVVSLRVSEDFSSPFLYGLGRPVIILPARMTQNDYASELPAIFAHELTHLQGRDLFWMSLLHALSIALWFHPFAWRIRAVHDTACEAVCDAVAAHHVGGSFAYSCTLARIALELVALPPRVGGIAMARMPEVRQRLDALKRNIDATPLGPRRVKVMLVAGGAVLTLIACMKLDPAGQGRPATPVAASAMTDGQEVSFLLRQGEQRQWQGLTVKLLRVANPTPAGEPPDPSRGHADFVISIKDQSRQRSMQVDSTEFVNDYRITLDAVNTAPGDSGVGNARFNIVNIAQKKSAQEISAQGQSQPLTSPKEVVMLLHPGEQKQWRDLSIRVIRVLIPPIKGGVQPSGSGERMAALSIIDRDQVENRSLTEGSTVNLGRYRLKLEDVTEQRNQAGTGRARIRVTYLTPNSVEASR